MSYESGPEKFPEHEPDDEPEVQEKPAAKNEKPAEKQPAKEAPQPKPEPPRETATGILVKEIEGAKASKVKITKERLKSLIGDAKAEYDSYKREMLSPDVRKVYEQDAARLRTIDEKDLERHVRNELRQLKNTIRLTGPGGLPERNAPPMSARDVKSFADYQTYRASKGEPNVNKIDYMMFKVTSPLRALGRIVGL